MADAVVADNMPAHAHRFEVWAPRVESLGVRIGDSIYPLEKGEEGHWSADIETVRPGTDYLFVLNRDREVPDPRSQWQPFGVHGPSRVLDHSEFVWTDEGFQAKPLASAALYELHIGTFTEEGTFDAAIDRLDHLVDLGITHLELMPVAEFPGRHGWGYDGVDLYAPHHAYGGPQGLKRLIDACHSRGLAVLLDVVYNHLGPNGNYLELFGPYFTDHHHTPWGKAINLDGRGSREVRRFICDNAVMWLRDYHFDGLRLDAVHELIDNSATHIVEELSCEVDRLEAWSGRHLVLIAESDLNDPRIVTARELGGYGMDAQWSDDFHHALHTALTGESQGYYADFHGLSDLAYALEHTYVYDGRYSSYRERVHGRRTGDLPGDRFVVCMQNHDQVGNRVAGDRSGHSISLGRLKIGAGLVFTSPFVPLLFQGEEWAASSPFQYFTDHEDRDLAEAVSKGRRNEFRAFGWTPDQVPDPQSLSTFLDSKLRWDELNDESHREMLEWTRQLIAVRKRLLQLSGWPYERVLAKANDDEQWLAFCRGPLVVACNVSEETRIVPLFGPMRANILAASHPGVDVTDRGARLPAETIVIACERR